MSIVDKTEDALIDVLDDNTIFVKDKIEFNYPTLTKKQRYLLLAKRGKVAEIIIDTQLKKLEETRKKKFIDFGKNSPINNFTFQECSFIIVQFDKYEIDPSIFPSIFNLRTDSKIEFIDCSFIGVVKNRISNFRVPTSFTLFSNLSSDHVLKFTHCYFQNLKSVYYSDLSALSLDFNNCYFEGISDIAISAYHPYQLKINFCNFFNVMENCVEISMDNYQELAYQEESFLFKSESFEKKIEINDCTFLTCHDGILVNSDKISGIISSTKIDIERNKFTNISKNGLTFENIFVREIKIKSNKITTCGFSGCIFINTKAQKPIVFHCNNLYSNHRLGLCIENTFLKVTRCRFTKCVSGIWINFGGYKNFTKEIESKILIPSSRKKNNKILDCEIMNTEHVLLITNRIHVEESIFNEIKKYGIIVASNEGGVIKIVKNSFQNMQAGICIKESCKGTISKKLKENVVNFFDEETSVKSTLYDREGESRPDLGVIVLGIKGQILLDGNSYERCEMKIRRRNVKSELFIQDSDQK